jgi:glycosyltransferase involved in cell wall biosynthesis
MTGDRPLHVVMMGSYLRFPTGMATTQRVRLLARAMQEAGAHVRILLLQASERPPHVENSEVRGTYCGIPFEYAAGTTVRHASFLMRRLIEVRGWVTGAARLAQLRRRGELDVVYLWFNSQRLELRRFAYTAVLRALGVPAVIEIDERPWPLRADVRPVERGRSPLAGMAGTVVISALLEAWARDEAARAGRRCEVLPVPIVVDVEEQTPAPFPTGSPVVVFAGAPEYEETIRFVFAAMERVWEEVPECRLVVTGANPTDPASRWLAREARRSGRDARLELAGYVEREELLRLYARAHALLVPLFDDVRSEARFPTKIGEYLSAGRPVVTSAVGEIPRYFEDGVDAVTCPPGDALAFGERLAGLLLDPELAESIGRAGRELAERRFHYALYGDELLEFFTGIAIARGGLAS